MGVWRRSWSSPDPPSSHAERALSHIVVVLVIVVDGGGECSSDERNIVCTPKNPYVLPVDPGVLFAGLEVKSKSAMSVEYFGGTCGETFSQFA